MKSKIIIIISVIIFILAGVWYAYLSDFFGKKKEIVKENESINVITNEAVDTPTPTVAPKLFCYVFICGNVNNPGVYKTEKGNRLEDIVEKAGGFSEYADRNYLNLARKVEDGERVYVPSYFETEELAVTDVIAGSGTVDMKSEEKNTETVKSQNGGKININTAGIDELVALPGIGESRARDIVEYRNKVGAFLKLEDIKNISGIGEALFGRIKDFICVE